MPCHFPCTVPVGTGLRSWLRLATSPFHSSKRPWQIQVSDHAHCSGRLEPAQNMEECEAMVNTWCFQALPHGEKQCDTWLTCPSSAEVGCNHLLTSPDSAPATVEFPEPHQLV